MRIALCMKQSLDPTGPFMLPENAVSLRHTGMIPISNPADLCALELARKAFPPGENQITAYSVGPTSVERVLRTSLTGGADHAVRVWDDSLPKDQLDEDVIARLLAAAIKKIGFDLVVCGSRSLDDETGYVGPALSEYLNIPLVCSVSDLSQASDSDGIKLHRKLDHGDREILSCRLPALITVDDGTIDIPYASFPAILLAEQVQIQVMNLAAMGLSAADVKPQNPGKFISYIPPRPRTKKTALPDKNLTPAQQMQMAMLGGGAGKKSSSFVEGDPKKTAAEIVRFLDENGFLSAESQE